MTKQQINLSNIDKIKEKLVKKVSEILNREHEKEAKKNKAEITNYGWGQGIDFIHSKTTKGLLFTAINLKTYKVSHSWDTD